VEDAFRAKLAALESAAGTRAGDIGDQPVSHVVSALQPSSSSLERQPVEPAPAIADGVDKSRLAHPEPRRFRDKEHVRFVAKQPCPTAELARCFLRLANLPNYALDRLSRYEATLWRQAGQILFANERPASAQTTG
jgi:hypothetical protein